MVVDLRVTTRRRATHLVGVSTVSCSPLHTLSHKCICDIVPPVLQGRFSSTASLPALCDCLHKAAYDPRVTGLIIKVDPLACGWGKLQELRRHIELFRASGKWTMAYMERCGMPAAGKAGSLQSARAWVGGS